MRRAALLLALCLPASAASQGPLDRLAERQERAVREAYAEGKRAGANAAFWPGLLLGVVGCLIFTRRNRP